MYRGRWQPIGGLKRTCLRFYVFASHMRAGLTNAQIAAIGMFLAIAISNPASAQVIYNSIPASLSGNAFSVSFQAQGVRERGDGVNLVPGTGRSLTTVTTVLSSFACQAGNWFNGAGGPNSCVSAPGSTFNQSITLNIYSVGPGNVTGPLITTVTQTFAMPYRPTDDPVNCG